MNIRILRILLIALLALLMAACGGGATPTATQAPATESNTVAPTDTAEPEQAETDPAEEDDATAVPAEEATEVEAGTEEATQEATADTSDVGNNGAQTDGATAIVTFPNTGVRTGPGTGFDVVATLTSGDRVAVIGQNGGTAAGLWFLVALESGEEGWLWSRVAQLEPADAEVPVAEDIPTAP